jgi:primosomal protein N' (replication factor Y)
MRSEALSADSAEYCQIALPVPLDRTFTYLVPEGLRGRELIGCRALVPFGRRKHVGVVLSVNRTVPNFDVRPLAKLLDDSPVLNAELRALAAWVAKYYCTPVGEVFKAMLPLGGETHSKKMVSITAEGEAELSAILLPSTVDEEVLAALARKPLTLQSFSKRIPGGTDVVWRLRNRGLVAVDEVLEERDPTLSRGATLLVGPGDPAAAPARPKAAERWLLDYLRRNPGSHDVRALAIERSDAVPTARRLSKLRAVELEVVHSPLQAKRSTVALALNPAQRIALTKIESAVEDGRFETFLLHGVTGSGKTEVYLRAIRKVLDQGRSALLLVPEIGLTPSVAADFFGRFGEQVAVLHSGLTELQRADQWRRIQAGKGRVVLGTRSAVFAPLRDLGLVVVDEEHDGSYKQGEAPPRYNARDVAIVRARSAKAAVVLGSATPGLETRHNADLGKYRQLSMPERILKRPLPSVRMVDMRREFSEVGREQLFSRALRAAVQACLERGEQAMIFLNRRGFSTYVLCRACGTRVECPNCSVTLTYHKRERLLRCHFCDHGEPVPTVCEDCDRDFLHFQGSGSEQVEDALGQAFPQARIARLDRDTVRGRNSFERILGSFKDGVCNLLVGTQMIAKGHDIPNVTLVCVVNADVGLGLPDFRAAERTFQLLTQVAGRAGRGEKPGEVLIQTMNPEHYAVKLAARQDYDAFYARETAFRRDLWYPPFTSIALLLIRCAKFQDALEMSRDLGRHLQPVPAGLRLLGPASAPVAKLRTEYRFQFVVKSQNRNDLARLLASAREYAQAEQWPATALTIDVDPLNFL